MHENGKMRPVETIQRRGAGRVAQVKNACLVGVWPSVQTVVPPKKKKKSINKYSLMIHRKMLFCCQVQVATICNPTYSGGRDQKDRGSKPALSENIHHKKKFFLSL
jgi:hypothetical protein